MHKKTIMTTLLAVCILLSAMTLVANAAASEDWAGYDLAAGKWEKANLGKAYTEGDFVPYQLKITTASKVWGLPTFSIRYDFLQASSDGVYVDGFDTADVGFQLANLGSDFLPDGTTVPPGGWGTHIPVPAAEPTPVTNAYIDDFMYAWPPSTVENPSSPQDFHYFNVTGLPWSTYASQGYILIYFRAHLALDIIWSNGLANALPTVLDGDYFNSWAGVVHHGASFNTGSSAHFYLDIEGVGAKTIPIPIAQYPSTIINGYKYVNDVPFNGWEITLHGDISLGSGMPPIEYDPPAVYTGTSPWATGYFEFTGLVTGTFTVTEESRSGYIHDAIVATGPADPVIKDLNAGTATFDLESSQTETIEFYNVLAESSTATLLSATSITLGQSVTDTATVTGNGPTPTGTVDFQVSTDMSSWTTFDSAVPLSSGSATSTSYTPYVTGTYYFRAIYSGDSTYPGSQSGDEEEPLTVGKATPDVNTLLSESSITLGGSVTDSVTVVGLGGSYPWPTGTVDFEVSIGGGAWTVYDDDVALTQSGSDGVATSTTYTPMAAGSYRFRAIYSGDGNYNGAQSGDEEEPLTVEAITAATRTIGYWQTHTAQTKYVFDSKLGGTINLDGKTIDDYHRLFGAFYASIPKTSTGDDRSALDQAKMILLQQLVGAILNQAENGDPSVTPLIAAGIAAFNGNDAQTAINCAQLLTAYNESGEGLSFDDPSFPYASATPGQSWSLAKDKDFDGLSYWDVLPAP